jgi:excisionase family DNA binding protein
MKNQPLNIQFFSHEPMTLNSNTSPWKSARHALMTEQEASTYLRVCRRSLYNWRKAGLIPYIRLGKAVRFRINEVEAAINRMAQNS